MNGEKITEVIHSHTPTAPYFITADIANYMFYGCDLHGVKRFSVLSTVFADTSYLTTFDVEKMKPTSIVHTVE